MTALRPDHLFDGHAFRPDAALADGRIVGEDGAEAIAGILSPGFLDLQVNGGGGLLFNDSPDVATARRIAAAHRAFGTVAILPTLITDAPEKMEAALDAARAFRLSDGLAGLHLEGPFIEEAKRGTHAAEFVRPMGDTDLRGLCDAAREIRLMVTVAPEVVGPPQIAALTEAGVIVSLGHSNCSAEEAQAAFAAGARSVTHLFNAMSQMTSRAPGLTGAAIASGAWCGLIADGIHAAPEMLEIAIRARPVPDRMVLVSDAMATVGGGDSFELYGQEIRLRDGRLVNAEGNLAGAHLTVADGVAKLCAMGLPDEAVLRMATANPAALIGLDIANDPDWPWILIGEDGSAHPVDRGREG
ncbi:N-acetylglucosamine-6-phosphate deacetylase [Aestuariibius sp. 2305UL40-4]|uniref:N-acetylglucosamine-6-phosphate deacetylase n=1 Tax=Aestuariibius violaceus TaxID=3234132 RepID=UPI00345E9A59